MIVTSVAHALFREIAPRDRDAVSWSQYIENSGKKNGSQTPVTAIVDATTAGIRCHLMQNIMEAGGL